MAVLNLRVNGRSESVDVDQDTPLLYVLSDNLRLDGPKYGCGQSQCGSCTVLLDGEPIRSCTTPTALAVGHEVITLEGIGTPQNPHPLQKLFVGEQAAQCGYCLSGIILYGMTFVDKNPNATEAQIMESLSGLICRCHTHVRMVRALVRYGQEKRA